MNRSVPFDENAVCDGCGALGAFDFMGDFFCQECLDKDKTAVQQSVDACPAKPYIQVSNKWIGETRWTGDFIPPTEPYPVFGKESMHHDGSAQQSLHLTALRRGLVVSVLVNIFLLVILGLVIGGR